MKLRSLMQKGEVLAEYGGTWDYFNTYHAITSPGHYTDISGALEDTLHRILDAGGTEEDVRELMGASGLSLDEIEEAESRDGCIVIDLDYCLPGMMLAYKILPETEKRNPVVRMTVELEIDEDEVERLQEDGDDVTIEKVVNGITLQEDTELDGYVITTDVENCNNMVDIFLCNARIVDLQQMKEETYEKND